MNPELNLEPFVDATRAAEFLGIKPRRLLEKARAGQIHGYPLGTGARQTRQILKIGKLLVFVKKSVAALRRVVGFQDSFPPNPRGAASSTVNIIEESELIFEDARGGIRDRRTHGRQIPYPS